MNHFLKRDTLYDLGGKFEYPISYDLSQNINITKFTGEHL